MRIFFIMQKMLLCFLELVLVIADGYSCREQIEQGAARCALPVAEVVKMSIQQQFDK